MHLETNIIEHDFKKDQEYEEVINTFSYTCLAHFMHLETNTVKHDFKEDQEYEEVIKEYKKEISSDVVVVEVVANTNPNQGKT